jgi:hypothetical protein
VLPVGPAQAVGHGRDRDQIDADAECHRLAS